MGSWETGNVLFKELADHVFPELASDGGGRVTWEERVRTPRLLGGTSWQEPAREAPAGRTPRAAFGSFGC